MMECKECGHKVSESAESCPNCGARRTTKKKKTSLFTWMFIAGVTYLIFFSNSSRDINYRESSKVSNLHQTKPQQAQAAVSVSPNNATRVVPSKTIREGIVKTVELNKLVSKAAFSHDVVGGDSRYTLLWVWMSGAAGKDYDAIARHFCSVFKVRNVKGATVSIKKNGSYDTLGRGYCR